MRRAALFSTYVDVFLKKNRVIENCKTSPKNYKIFTTTQTPAIRTSFSKKSGIIEDWPSHMLCGTALSITIWNEQFAKDFFRSTKLIFLLHRPSSDNLMISRRTLPSLNQALQSCKIVCSNYFLILNFDVFYNAKLWYFNNEYGKSFCNRLTNKFSFFLKSFLNLMCDNGWIQK